MMTTSTALATGTFVKNLLLSFFFRFVSTWFMGRMLRQEYGLTEKHGSQKLLDVINGTKIPNQISDEAFDFLEL